MKHSVQRSEISSSEWKEEVRKAEAAMSQFIKKLPSETVQEEYHHRCQCRFQELIQQKFPYPFSFYKECFRKIFVDMCRKNSLYLHTYSKPATCNDFLNEKTTTIDPTPGVTKATVLMEAIEELSPDEQLIVYLMDFLGLSTSQVATILGKDQSTYSRQHKKILLKMKESIVNKWGEEIWSL
ncbi:MAG TPA: sigma factor-like helix-turn-helix DNA-binding protein [Caldisericia bacterium]|nr:sigma factor-like helix-turn-helix DNA-binding protein [Caldisericia bacterium]